MQKSLNKVSVKCEYCGTVVLKNKKTHANKLVRNKHHFCSLSCKSKFYADKNPKLRISKRKTKIYYCIICGQITSARKKYCKDCNPNCVDWSKLTLADLKNKRKYQVHSRIRDLARRIYMKSKRPRKCIVCGYSKHIEICHRKSIASFSLSTPISEINKLSNLDAFCPTHHWEFDNNQLDTPLPGIEPGANRA